MPFELLIDNESSTFNEGDQRPGQNGHDGDLSVTLSGNKMQRVQSYAQTILDSIPDGILLLESSGIISSANEAAGALFGCPSSEIPGGTISMCLFDPQCEDTSLTCAFNAVENRGDSITREMAARRSDGSVFPVEVTLRRIEIAPKGSFVIIVHDISLRRKLQQDVLRISVEEREHIGQDIHDYLASKFSGLALMGRGLLKQLNANPEFRIPAGTIEYMVDQARAGAERARILARGLNPAKLEKRGLEAALVELTKQVEVMVGITCHLDYHRELPRLRPSLASQLYRIAHEAVMNAMKHSGTDRLEITVQPAASALSLRIQDFGKGLSHPVNTDGGMGIHIMEQRAGLINASLTIDSPKEGGTIVSCQLPLNY